MMFFDINLLKYLMFFEINLLKYFSFFGDIIN